MGYRVKQWHFTVEGQGEFPVDMLRYDACWPRTTEDALEMKLAPHDREELRRDRKIELVTWVHEPTKARWRSFGWYVADVREVR